MDEVSKKEYLGDVIHDKVEELILFGKSLDIDRNQVLKLFQEEVNK